MTSHGVRDALPPDLVTLLADFPRHLWPENPGFHGLASFWLERHLAFRQTMALLQKDAEDMSAARMDPAQWRQRVARLGTHLVQDLTGHHQIEDHAYFPQMQRLEPRMIRGFDLLETDHDALHHQIDNFVETANDLLQRPDLVTSDGEVLAEVLIPFERFLIRHLSDEEDLVIPLILKHRLD